MTYSTIRYETDGRIARITLDRPDRLNAITPDMPREIHAGSTTRTRTIRTS